MRRQLFIGIMLLLAMGVRAKEVIDIPLQMSTILFMPQDNPTGSTPDPTDPNQFRASLTGNTLHIETQAEAVSYVVIREWESDKHGEDYFYEVSYGEVTCPITRPGTYTILIGYWKTDFYGQITVHSIDHFTFDGRRISDTEFVPSYCYLTMVSTSLGRTTTKICVQP